MSDFSQAQLSVLQFFETKVAKSTLFKIRDKVDKKAQEVEKSSDKDKAKKELQFKVLKQEQLQERRSALTSVIPDWLTECADKAISVDKPMLKVSHPAKFSHGAIPYAGLYIKPAATAVESNYYITTESLHSRYFDIAMSNGNLITHGRFLKTLIDDGTIYEKLEKDDDVWLTEFSKDKAQLKHWAIGLKHWIAIPDTLETSRLKQNYFPTPDADEDYHLIAPLFSSVLCQAIYEQVRASRFDKEQVLRHRAKKAGKYRQGETIDFPNLAIMNFGGSQPQNITVGNFERHGEAYLLSCAPPHWKSELQPPFYAKSLYGGEFNRRAWKSVRELQTFLVKFHGDKSNKRIRDHIKRVVHHIIDILLGYVSQVQSLEKMAGWSVQSDDLKLSHKLWLDPFRDDISFQNSRRAGDWQDEVCKDFGLWLNHKLEHKKMIFAKIESKHWAILLKAELRKFERDSEVKQ